jgi:hypothetical protein
MQRSAVDFPRAGRPDDTDDLALVDRQREVLEHDVRAEGLRDAVDDDHLRPNLRSSQCAKNVSGRLIVR